eukprot:scaffold122947_cov44-Tisochrysis_lutea.AAC.2
MPASTSSRLTSCSLSEWLIRTLVREARGRAALARPRRARGTTARGAPGPRRFSPGPLFPFSLLSIWPSSNLEEKSRLQTLRAEGSFSTPSNLPRQKSRAYFNSLLPGPLAAGCFVLYFLGESRERGAASTHLDPRG